MVKKLPRKKIATYQGANPCREQEYLPEHNRRFAIPASSQEDFHMKSPGKRALDDVFRLEEERTIYPDWVVRYGSRYFQVERTGHHPPAKSKVTVCEWEDGRIEIRYRGERVANHQTESRPVVKVQATVQHRPPNSAPPPTQHP